VCGVREQQATALNVERRQPKYSAFFSFVDRAWPLTFVVAGLFFSLLWLLALGYGVFSLLLLAI
jgi:hypothetical protein